MDRDAELEGVADAGGLDARTYPAPERRIEQDHIHRAIQDVRSQLLEIDDDRVGGERHAHLLARVPHAGEAEDRVFEVIVVEVFYRTPEPDRLLGRPDGVGIEAEAVAGQRLRDGAVALEIVIRRE